MDGWFSVNIVPRGDWGAKPATDKIELLTPVPEVLHTYTDTDPCVTKEQCFRAMRELQESHMNQGLPDIKYNFVVGGDGNVYEGRGWTTLPDLNIDYPGLWESSIEIAHIGREGMPEEETLFVARDLLQIGVLKNHVKKGFRYIMHFHESDEGVDEYTLDSEKGTFEEVTMKGKQKPEDWISESSDAEST